ncbi:hypothetical protein V2H45_23875 [Tumidithrix elongata RA019]|uniref:Uncharacterized protein n=1 Tax=Tumidithrix elongata BACA0141 TaxID=2716417 RepID=A0AAW9Q3U2_9CYAN|nr:hypothetical protein [Tumidithrix elongata RA019]
MSINNLIIWFVFLSCGLTIIRTGGSRDRRGWAIVAAAILVVTVVLLYFAPKWASPISGSLWLILIVFPTVLLQWVNRLVYQQSYRKARMLAECVRWLHPADGLDRYPKLLYSLEMAQNGNMEAAREILSQHQDLKTPEGRYAAMMLYRMDCQWDELLTWIRDRFPEKVLHKDPNLLMNYLRALGETGDLNSLVKELGKFEQSADKNKDPMSLNASRMTVLAFCGEVIFVKALFSNQLKVYSQEISNFWIATAEMAAGMEVEAKEKLIALNRSSDISMQKAIAWRLSHGSLSDRTLTDESKQILAQLETDLQHEESYGGAIKRTGKRVHATYVLIGLNLLAFALEIGLGGNQYIEPI